MAKEIFGFSEQSLNHLENDLLIRRQNMLLERDYQKYRYMVFTLNLVHPGLKCAYFAGRWLDDVVDGDENLPFGFNSVDEWINQIENHVLAYGTEKQTMLLTQNTAFLFQRAIQHLQPLEKKTQGGNVQTEFAEFLEAMRSEYHRRINPVPLAEDEIVKRYWDCFSHAQNITLIALKAKERIPSTFPTIKEMLEMSPHELPLILPIILGKDYAVHDLKEELAKGICNIPDKVLAESGIEILDLINNPNITDTNKIIQSWMKEELQVSSLLVKKLRRKKMDFRSKLLVRFLTTGI